jgi:DNA polymerase-3 subunit delta'
MARAPKMDVERPPFDAIEGVPLPRETSAFIGHRQAQGTLLDAYRSGRMHHGWVLAGERGIGKATLAFRLARFLFAHPEPDSPDVAMAEDLGVSPQHAAARKVAAGTHPNLLHQQREWNDKTGKFRSDIAVETVRRIGRFLGTTAGEGGWRVVIVDPADDMNRSAANALLKSLEEPPPRTLFLLLARSRGALLPTILSRCRTLDLAPLTEAEASDVVRQVAPHLAPASEDHRLAATLAGGSVRRLIELSQQDGLAQYRLLLSAVEESEPRARYALAAQASDDRVTEQILSLYQDYLLRRVRGTPEPAKTARPPSLPLVTWAELWEKATLSWREVDTYNLDRRQFVLDLMETTAAARRQAAVRS